MSSGIVSFPSVMDIYDVKEMFSRYYVDPDIAQQNVPSQWTVKIHDNGKALLLVMVQECKKMVLDYLFNVGSVGMSHIWIELDGPPEIVVPLPGTTRSLPTWYWYILPHELDGYLIRKNGVKSTIDPCKTKKNYGVTLNCELHSSLCTIQKTCGISIKK